MEVIERDLTADEIAARLAALRADGGLTLADIQSAVADHRIEDSADVVRSAGGRYRYVRPFAAAADDLIEYLQNPEGRLMLGLREIDVMTRGFGRGELCYITGFAHCLTPDAEALTPTGWVTHDRIRVGDSVWGVNPATGESGWTLVEAVNVFDYSGPLVVGDNRSASIACTPEHKWPTAMQHDRRFVLRRTDELNTSHHIPRAVAAAGASETHPDWYVELVGWTVTEGSYPRIGKSVDIYQSLSANPEKCERIRSALRASGHPWREGMNRGCMVATFAWELGRKMRSEFPDKVLTREFIDSLSQRQRHLLIDVMILGDGTVANKDGVRRYMSSRADGFAHLLAAAGIPFSQRERKQVTKFGAVTMSIYTLQRAKSIYWARMPTETIHYSGVVWCPTTTFGTWLTRKDGTVYYTGNSGKTQLFLTGLVNNRHRPIVLFTLDEPSELVLAKLVSLRKGWNFEWVEERVKADDRDVIRQVRDVAASDFSKLIVVDESLDLKQMADAMKEARDFFQEDIDAVGIDYLDLLRDGEDTDGKSQALKRWTKDQDVAVLAIHQGGKGESAKGQPITLATMRFGGHAEAIFVLGCRRKRDDESLDGWERSQHEHTISISVVKNKRPPSKRGEFDFMLDPESGIIRSRPEPGPRTVDAAVQVRAQARTQSPGQRNFDGEEF